MIFSPLPTLLTLLLAQKVPSLETLKCEEVQRIELSRASPMPREVCVSPGLLTGFFFEGPVSVEIQEESRFEEVSRSPMSVSFLPPKDMVSGERLRLSVRYADGSTRDAVPLMLVAAPGQGTRQVEVFRDTRTRESFEEELKQERVKSLRATQELVRVQLEFERFRQQHGDLHQLRWLIISGALADDGIRTRESTPSWVGQPFNAMVVRKCITYRSVDRLAIAIWLVGSSHHPWWARAADIKIDKKPRHDIDVWQQGDTASNDSFLLIAEADSRLFDQASEVTLSVKGDNREKIIFSGIELP